MSLTAPFVRSAAMMALIGAVMPCGHSAGLRLASGLQVASQASQRGDGGEKRIRLLAGVGANQISVKVPANWRVKYWRPAVEPYLTIGLLPQHSSQDFQVLLSPLLPEARWMGRLRRLVESLPEGIKAASVETEFPLQPVKGLFANGFYFSATARTPQLGKYKLLTQGAFKTGALLIAFTVLTNEGQEQIVQQALELVRSARHVIGGRVVPGNPPRAPAWSAAHQIDPEWALVTAVPGFEGRPGVRQGTASTSLTALPELKVEGEAVDRSAPSPVSFRLGKLGNVLRIRWVRREHGQTQAIATAIQLAGTRGEAQFALNLIVDGEMPQTRPYEVGKLIEFEARGALMPYQIRVTEIAGQTISGEIAPSSPVGRIEFDFYTADGGLIEKSPHLRRRLQPSEADKEVNNPVVLHQTLPRYTDAAINAKITGTILVGVVVREDGSVGNIQVHIRPTRLVVELLDNLGLCR